MPKLILLTSCLLILSLFACASAPYDKLDYYDDGEFVNLEGEYESDIWAALKWQIFDNNRKPWPENVEVTKRPAMVERSVEPRLTFVTHSTFLLQVDNINILFDPVFSDRVSPFQWIGPQRVIENPVDKEDIPKVDFIFISHDHYDHLDYNSLTYFKDRDNPTIYAGLEVGKVDRDLDIVEMAWWDEVKTENYQFVFTPCQHFSGRGLFNRNETLWGGFYIKVGDFKVYFGGDTGYSSHFMAVKERFKDQGQIDLAILPIGAYEPQWFMSYIHVNPSEAVQAHIDLDPKLSVSMHWGTFQLSDEARMEPVEDLKKALEEKQVDNFYVIDFGEVLNFNPEPLDSVANSN